MKEYEVNDWPRRGAESDAHLPEMALSVDRRNSRHQPLTQQRRSLDPARGLGALRKNDRRQRAVCVAVGGTHVGSNEGAVIRHRLHKLAVYRDPQGEARAFDATCPHLGCIVEWNSTEKSWDCPCHGSRFDARGRVINGPATSNLNAAELPSGSLEHIA
jgi:Rieske Fe-S protein